VRYIAQPYPVGAQPFVVRQHGNCVYPWCEHKEFADKDKDKALPAHVFDETGRPHVGNMHVSHTIFAHRYDDGKTEYHEDDIEQLGHQQFDRPRRTGDKLLEEVINTVPTSTVYVSNIEDLVKKLDVNEVLIIKRAGGSTHRTRVNVWRKMP
jgi:hypothetical protein